MASLDSGSVLPPPRYNPHEFASPYLPCTSGIATKLNAPGEGLSSSPRCGNPVKSVSSVSAVSVNQTPTASPSYSTGSSWSGYDGKNSLSLQSAGPSNDTKTMSALSLDISQKKQKTGVYVFTSKMANEAYECVQQSRFDSILAWHEAHCPPSTSTAGDSSPAKVDPKRKNTDATGRTLEAIDQASNGQPTKLARSVSENGARLTSNEQLGGLPPSSASSNVLMLNEDADVNSSSDNPIRRMEKMTQDSLFEPPAAKVARGNSSENEQFVRKTTGEDNAERATKLERLKNAQQLINGCKNRVQPQCSQLQWDRMLQEQEAMKIPRAYPPQMMPGYPAQGVIGGPPPYQMPPHGILPGMHPAFRRPPFMGQISPQVMSPVPPVNGPVMDSPGAPGMSMRPSLNPPPYNVHLTPDGYMPYEFAPSSFSSQGYSMTMQSTVSPAYSPMFSSMNSAPMPPRGYPVYSQGPRPIYQPDKMVPPEMWGQQLPQPLSNLEARIPNQKIQYHPDGAVIDGNLGENINNVNLMFG